MYYTPTNDELYDGVEYIENDIIKVYHHQVENIYNKKIKLLNREDILKFGFNLKSSTTNEDFFSKPIIGSQPTFFEIILRTIDNVPYVSLYKTSTLIERTVLINDLHIKNINEFKWIMNRYGVL